MDLRLVFAGIVGHAEPVERHRGFAAVDRDQVGVALALRKNPARFALVGKMSAALRISDRFAHLLLVGIEQAKLDAPERLAGGE